MGPTFLWTSSFFFFPLSVHGLGVQPVPVANELCYIFVAGGGLNTCEQHCCGVGAEHLELPEVALWQTGVCTHIGDFGNRTC